MESVGSSGRISFSPSYLIRQKNEVEKVTARQQDRPEGGRRSQKKASAASDHRQKLSERMDTISTSSPKRDVFQCLQPSLRNAAEYWCPQPLAWRRVQPPLVRRPLYHGVQQLLRKPPLLNRCDESQLNASAEETEEHRPADHSRHWLPCPSALHGQCCFALDASELAAELSPWFASTLPASSKPPLPLGSSSFSC